MSTIKLTCLYNADGQVIGYFSDHVAAQAARTEWNEYYASLLFLSNIQDLTPLKCRSVETYIKPAELESVEPGEGDRVDYIYRAAGHLLLEQRCSAWLDHGAASVEVSRYSINRYRSPGKSWRDSDLGGPAEAAGVLYVLRIKAPK